MTGINPAHRHARDGVVIGWGGKGDFRTAWAERSPYAQVMSVALANLTTRHGGGAAIARLVADEDRRAPRLAKAACWSWGLILNIQYRGLLAAW